MIHNDLNLSMIFFSVAIGGCMITLSFPKFLDCYYHPAVKSCRTWHAELDTWWSARPRLSLASAPASISSWIQETLNQLENVAFELDIVLINWNLPRLHSRPLNQYLKFRCRVRDTGLHLAHFAIELPKLSQWNRVQFCSCITVDPCEMVAA